MTRICLDTSAYSHFRRGRPEAVHAIETARRVFVPAVVLGELRAGFRVGSRGLENEDALRRFLAEPLVEVLAVDDDAASLYAEIWADLRRRGVPLPINDLWVAAVAAREGATIVTYDAHFESIRRVGLCLLSQ